MITFSTQDLALSVFESGAKGQRIQSHPAIPDTKTQSYFVQVREPYRIAGYGFRSNKAYKDPAEWGVPDSEESYSNL